MIRTRVVCVILLAVCVTLPAFRLSNPTAYTITCSSGTACKSGTIPVFTTTGGASKVDSSIVSQSGSTISVAGSVSAKTAFDIGGTPCSPSALWPRPAHFWDLPAIPRQRVQATPV